MKILHIIDSEGLYGAEIIIISLITELKRMGVQTSILNLRPCPENAPTIAKESRKHGLNFYIIPLRAGLDLRGAFKLLHYALCHDFDIIHSHGYKSNVLLGGIPKCIRKLPIVTTLHGYTNTDKKLSKMGLYEWLDRRVLSRMDAVVLVSPRMLSHPKLKTIKNVNYQVIENGIIIQPSTETADEPPPPEISDFSRDGFIIGSVGRLSQEKGHAYLIDAFQRIAPKIPEAKLLILGEGSLRQLFETKINEAGLQNRVLMPGYLENASRFMKFFDVFVLPSLTEGLPVTLLEAIRADKPVVATKVGSMTDFVKHGRNGLQVEPADMDALADAVEQIYHDKNLREPNEKTNADLLKQYSSERMASDYLRLYQRILQKQAL